MDGSAILAWNMDGFSQETSHIVAGIAGNLFALVLFLSPLPTFQRISRNQSIEQFSVLPYLFALLNCLICMWYGLPFVSANNILVVTVNATGAAFQLTYIFLYIVHSPKEVWVKVFGLLLTVLGIFFVVAAVSSLLMEQPHRMMFVGYLTVISLISMFASPLSIMKLVIETKSVEFMPFYLSLSTFLMSTSFFAYGLLGNDLFIMIPNGIGSLLGLLQLGLYAHYKKIGTRNLQSQPLLDSKV